VRFLFVDPLKTILLGPRARAGFLSQLTYNISFFISNRVLGLLVITLGLYNSYDNIL
jgi:hypothetical protein